MPRSSPTTASAPPDLQALYDAQVGAIRTRLREFAAVPPTAYLYEVIYCLLTPQSSARNAQRAVDALQRQGFAEQPFDPESALSDRAHYIRFHRTKARRLLELHRRMPEVLTALTREMSPFDLREWLVKHVNGLGYKEATHVLRNIGRSGDLAILDRHILRNMKRYGAIRVLPKTITRRQYLRLERSFQRFARRIGIPPDELDLLLWSMETGEILK